MHSNNQDSRHGLDVTGLKLSVKLKSDIYNLPVYVKLKVVLRCEPFILAKTEIK